ncbi:hypothetical protein [Pseudomonas citronellolis]|uniref:hypothetical protein n=1 Tax=Pseudomonas citronellolis TaxID=53408 RepID=UPI0012FD24D8|nr:hypothetical protein [Pseudomonas citronellolis]
MDRKHLEHLLAELSYAYNSRSSGVLGLVVYRFEGYCEALYQCDVISLEVKQRLFRLSSSVLTKCSAPYLPDPLNAGPVMPSWIAYQRRASA